jgi:cyanate lyase
MMVTKQEAAEAVRAAKARLGVTWAQLADAVGRPAVWTTSALLGQQPMTAAEAAAAGSLLELGEDVSPPGARWTRRSLPTRRSTGSMRCSRSTARRSRSSSTSSSATIMSAINFRLDVRREPDPAGDRVIVTLDGKFLPYQW